MAIAKRKPAEPVRIDIKKEDTVKVISGRDKGKQGRVLSVNLDVGHGAMAFKARARASVMRRRTQHPKEPVAR